MNLESMQFYGINKEFDQCDYFETEHYQNILRNVSAAIKLGGIIALTGIVGTGKTVTVRRIQQAICEENKILISKSLASDKRRVTINTLCTALFADLATKKYGKLSTQAENRERKIQALIKDLGKPVALFIDEAHYLQQSTLISLKHLVEIVRDAKGTLSIIVVGHPKLMNDLRHPALEEIGARVHFFELNVLGVDGVRFIEWIITHCTENKIKPHDIVTKEAIACLSERLITPLQITCYLTRALEKGFQIGEKPLNIETVKTILSPDLNVLSAALARSGYNFAALCNHLNAKPSEVKAYLEGRLGEARTEEIHNEIHKLGTLI
jgi:type II secretory pathway predicted ATPase ExeA